MAKSGRSDCSGRRVSLLSPSPGTFQSLLSERDWGWGWSELVSLCPRKL